jgi:phospholipid/cholesterol/gamma-HCH transport system substrate-binding protein
MVFTLRGPARVLAPAVVLAPMLALGGCSVLPGDGSGGGGAGDTGSTGRTGGSGSTGGVADGQRRLTAYFPQARSFYPHSRVKIMGADVGMVDRVRSMGDRIRVDFHIRGDIPIARGVRASIVPLNLVGERNLVLHPVWRPGMARELGGMRREIVIPIERTHVPVETDAALAAFTKVANALDPTKTRAALGKAARSVDGNGQDFNAALEQGSQLTDNVAAQDQELLAVARNLDRLAGVVHGREQIIGTMIRDFGAATQMLAGEREDIQGLIRGVLELSRQGDGIIRKYEGQLPYDLAVLTRVALTLKGDAKQVGMLIKALPGIGAVLIQAYDPKIKGLRIRFPTDAYLRTWLMSLLGSNEVGCPLPPPNSNCPWQGRRGRAVP